MCYTIWIIVNLTLSSKPTAKHTDKSTESNKANPYDQEHRYKHYPKGHNVNFSANKAKKKRNNKEKANGKKRIVSFHGIK